MKEVTINRFWKFSGLEWQWCAVLVFGRFLLECGSEYQVLGGFLGYPQSLQENFTATTWWSFPSKALVLYHSLINLTFELYGDHPIVWHYKSIYMYIYIRFLTF